MSTARNDVAARPTPPFPPQSSMIFHRSVAIDRDRDRLAETPFTENKAAQGDRAVESATSLLVAPACCVHVSANECANVCACPS
jgi:hypothetical protein